MLIVGGQVPQQDVLLVFKVLQGNCRACFPLALPMAKVTQCSAYTGSVPVSTGCLSAVLFLILPLLALKSPSSDDQLLPD